VYEKRRDTRLVHSNRVPHKPHGNGVVLGDEARDDVAQVALQVVMLVLVV
jgi:hypothetical protein